MTPIVRGRIVDAVISGMLVPPSAGCTEAGKPPALTTP